VKKQLFNLVKKLLNDGTGQTKEELKEGGLFCLPSAREDGRKIK